MVADVISLDIYREYKQIVKIDPDETCDRPFHLERYVISATEGHICVLCSTSVVSVEHPTMDGSMYYG